MKFEVETTTVRSTVTRMEETIQHIAENRAGMFAAMEALDGMWAGQAHDAFAAQYVSDNELVLAVITGVQDIIEKISVARQSYETCESEAVEMIAAVQI